MTRESLAHFGIGSVVAKSRLVPKLLAKPMRLRVSSVLSLL